ncbi:restriction endonuclease subunit S [Halobaculum magnesiiphilum]|uniref:Restriction endonuclease subunit S n=1 Tax=Halobaculum magnesiiphilum TaxID=1017351 RepID=A0A8T8W923_9EURY|nr:restriction endonuclease subunit S [Halobaculum magnesiiphilum]QZP36345.1 restriction endonuclease subunit S [Halobaculum magnesiiphilum]
MSDDDIPTDQPDDSPTTDATETAADGGAVATEALQSRFWGVVPTEWELVDGTEVYDVNPSYTPEEEEITYIEMDALDTELPFPKYATKRKAADYSGKLFREGDTLFARITPCTENGKAAFVDAMETNVGIGSTEYAVLSPDRERIHPLYLYYVAKSYPVRNYAISRMRGSTGRQRVPFDVFRKELEISLPPMEEQQKTASILMDIDQAIEKTNEILQQTHRVKKGVTQELLREGTRSHDDFKDTAVGRIPSEWEVCSIGDVVELAQYGLSESLSTEGEYPVFRMNNIENGYMVDSPMKYIDLEDDEFEKYKVEKGDILFNRTNSYELVGKTGLFNLEGDYVFASYLVRLRANSHADPYYLNYYLNSKKGQDRLMAFATKGVSQANINAQNVQRILMPRPPVEEQQEIAEVIREFDRQIESNEQYKSQLARIKRGLLSDLISGDVRTNQADIEINPRVSKHG